MSEQSKVVFSGVEVVNPLVYHAVGVPFSLHMIERDKTLRVLAVKDGKLTFEGDVDASARAFFEKVIEVYEQQHGSKS